MCPNFMDETELDKLLSELDPSYAAKKSRPASKGGKHTILAVDDMPAVLNSLKSTLKYYYNVIGVTSTSMASEFLSIQYADLILLDIEMPGENGFSFARSLKSNERTCWIPIVFLTGTSTQASVIEAFRSGGIDYIVKPINEKILLEKLTKILK